MKNYFSLLFTLCLIISVSTGCAEDEELKIDGECIADLAVTALDAPASVIYGNPASIVCTIKNLTNTFQSSCTSGTTNVRVEHGYNEEFKGTFSEYVVYKSYEVSIDPLDPDGEQTDPAMPVPMEKGPGHYATRVTTYSENDNNTSNNARAAVISAN